MIRYPVFAKRVRGDFSVEKPVPLSGMTLVFLSRNVRIDFDEIILNQWPVIVFKSDFRIMVIPHEDAVPVEAGGYSVVHYAFPISVERAA